MFCGAGGSSLGLVAAGVEVRVAANHWARAVETHALNFPSTDHDVADLSQVDPRRYPPTDLLWASPECINHSPARGVARAAMRERRPLESLDRTDLAARSRATMWDVCRFTEAAQLRGRPYASVIVENVIEATRWGPGGNGGLFRAWLNAMDCLGYEHRSVIFNSAFAFHPRLGAAPQLRDRLYVVFWQRGAPRPDLDLPVTAHCPQCASEGAALQRWKRPHRSWGRWRAQYQYHCVSCGGVATPRMRPAAAALDWTDVGRRIAERDRPLSASTRTRIAAGLSRHTRRSRLDLEDLGRAPRVGRRSGPRPRRSGDQVSFPVGFVMRNNGAHGRAGGEHCTSFAEPMRTLTTAGHQSLVVAPAGGSVDDAYLRMLHPHEMGAAMAFPEDYVVVGNQRERARQYGNAVTPPAAALLAEAVSAALYRSC